MHIGLGAILVLVWIFYDIGELQKRASRLENRVWDLEEKLHLHDKEDI